jgi:hypothetical protein
VPFCSIFQYDSASAAVDAHAADADAAAMITEAPPRRREAR